MNEVMEKYGDDIKKGVNKMAESIENGGDPDFTILDAVVDRMSKSLLTCSMYNNDPQLVIKTLHGDCRVAFPQGSTGCVFVPICEPGSSDAEYYFKESVRRMFKEHGYGICLNDITPDDMLKYCNRLDLGIEIVKPSDQE